jgi:SAM-dependent methyltransferase
MTDNNDTTLQSYEDHLQDYIASNVKPPGSGYTAWMDTVLGRIPKDGRVLELGSGDGRDAAYITSRGYALITTDAADGFVNLLKQKGFEAHKLNVLTDSFTNNFGADFDLVFANAVFLHFTPEQLQRVLRQAHGCLKQGGILAFSVKQGRGSEWSSNFLGAPRYFQFWQRPGLEKLVTAAGFTVQETTERQGSQAIWLHVTARK